MPLLTEGILAAIFTTVGVIGGALLNASTGWVSSKRTHEIEESKIALSAMDISQQAMLELIKNQADKIDRLDARIDKAYEARDLLADRLDHEQEYVDILVRHINLGSPPPPPPRP